MKNLIIYSHKDCLLKDNGPNHPERKERIQTIIESSKKIKNIKIDFQDSPIADLKYIKLVHQADYIEKIRYISRNIASTYLMSRKKLGFPMADKSHVKEAISELDKKSDSSG